MNADLVTVTLDIEGVDAALRVSTLEGVEAMNALYTFDLLLWSESAPLDLDAVVGQRATLGIALGEQRRSLHGVVSALEEGEAEEGRAVYRATLVPQAWLLSQGRRCRILQGQTTPQIIAQVLAEGGLGDVRLSLQGSYAPREACVQYFESDWAFLGRLMEEDGIFYFFEHAVQGSTLVVADHQDAHDTLGEPGHVPYGPSTGALTGGEAVLTFRFANRIRPGRVALLDVPFDTPTRRDEQQAGDAGIEVCAYPSATPAKRALGALQVARNVASGTARSVRLCPGSTFTLTGHARASFDASYLVTRVEHAFTADGEAAPGQAYALRFAAIPAGTPCLPEARTPKPRVVGPQAAEVVGPPGVEIHVDDSARVLVKLEWDPRRDDLAGALWVPIAQGASGAGYGAMAVPRVGSYVLVEFLNGDPDRPIITGRVFNSVSPYPYALPENRSKTVLRTRSTPGGDGHNELRFEDLAGSEQVHLRAQRDLGILAQNDATRTVGNDDTLTVGGDRSVQVAGARSTQIGGDDALAVGGSHSVAVAGEQTIAIAGDRGLSVGGSLEDLVVGDRTVEVEGSDELVVQGDRSVAVEGNRTTSVTGNDATAVEGNLSESVQGNLQIIVDGTTFETHSALQVAVSGDTTFKGSGNVLLESDTAHRIGAPVVYVSAGSKLYLRAKQSIELQVGNAKITLEDDLVHITSGSSHQTFGGSTHKLNC